MWIILWLWLSSTHKNISKEKETSETHSDCEFLLYIKWWLGENESIVILWIGNSYLFKIWVHIYERGPY